MELCAGVPATPHMNRGRNRGLHGLFKTSVEGIIDRRSAQAVVTSDVEGKNHPLPTRWLEHFPILVQKKYKYIIYKIKRREWGSRIFSHKLGIMNFWLSIGSHRAQTSASWRSIDSNVHRVSQFEKFSESGTHFRKEWFRAFFALPS